MSSTKILICEQEFEGNLKDNKQSFNINFMPREGELCEKIRLMLIAPGKKGENAFTSLYMLNVEQIDTLILGLWKARCFLAMQHNELTEFTETSVPHILFKKMVKISHEMRIGL